MTKITLYNQKILFHTDTHSVNDTIKKHAWLFKCFRCGRGAGDSGILQEGDKGTGGL